MERAHYGGAARGIGARRLALALVVAALAAALAMVAASLQAGPAEAAFPGPNGRIAFEKRDGTENNDYEIYTSNPDGSGRIQITKNQVDDFDPAFSPDGRSLVYSVLSVDSGPEGGGGAGIYRIDLGPDGKPSGGRELLVSGDGGFVAFPAWSPDGREITFSAGEGGPGDLDIYRTRSDGEGSPTFVADAGPFDAYPAWSPDGESIAFSGTFLIAGQSFVYVVPVDGSAQPSPITDPEESAYGPNWSPDGERIAYAAIDPDSQGSFPFAYQIYTRDAEEGTREQVTDTTGSINVFPAYSPRGDQIAFRAIGFTEQPGLNGLESAARSLDARDLAGLASGSSDRVGTLGGPQTITGVGRVPSDGGNERLVPGTESTVEEEGLFIGLIIPGPDWGQKAERDGNDGGRPDCTIQGTRRDDAINGTEGRDVICAGGGDDGVNALGGNDVVYGGSGDDAINGGDGDDELYGEGGNDSLTGEDGDDKLQGGPGRDEQSQ